MALFKEPAPDFSDPLGLLAACHQRILGHCALLRRMLVWLREQGADAEIQTSAQSMLRYFDSAAPYHHADEEQDLFPILEQSPEMAALLDPLRGEHRRLEASWGALRPCLTALAQGCIPEGLETAVDGFVAAQTAHIQTEETRVLPMARIILDASQIQALGLAMARRRALTSTAADSSGA